MNAPTTIRGFNGKSLLVRLKNGVCWLTPLLVLALLGRALQVPQEQSRSQRTYKVEGAVVDSITGRPVSRALVQLLPWPDGAVLTGSEGTFSFDDVPEGLMQILVTKPGFIYHGTSTLPSAVTSMQLGPNTGKLLLKITQAAVISGQVTDKDQEPLERVVVDLLGVSIADGRQKLIPSRQIQTDVDGNFRFGGLAPGRYYVAVKAHQASPGTLGLRYPGRTEGYPEVTYYPSANNLASALPIELTAGKHLELRFLLEPVPVFSVAGSVANLAAWSEVDPPAFVDEMGQVLLQANNFNRQNGAFTFQKIAAGSYLVRLGATDHEGRHTSLLQRVNVDDNVAGLELSFQDGVDIPVIVRTDFSQPRPVQCASSDARQKNASGCPAYPAARLELHSFDSSSTQFYSQLEPRKNPPEINVRGIVPGKYVVIAKPTIGGYVQSVRCGSLDLLQEPLVVPEGGHLPPIEVILRDDAGALTVQLHGDAPDQQVQVLILSEPRALAGPQVVATVRPPEFQSGPLPPGTYKVFAFNGANAVEYTDSDTLDKYASQAVTVDVIPRSNASVAVDVIRVAE